MSIEGVEGRWTDRQKDRQIVVHREVTLPKSENIKLLIFEIVVFPHFPMLFKMDGY